MKKFLRSLARVWKGGITKSLRMLHVFLPLSIFFAVIISFSGSFFFAYGTINHLVKNFESKLNIVVYLDRSISQITIDDVTSEIQSIPYVNQIEFISATQALEVFKERYADDSVTLEALAETGTNPFGASIVVFAKDPTKYSLISDEITKINNKFNDESLQPIEDVSYHKHKIAIDRFSTLLQKGEVALAIVLILVSIILLLIVYLAIRFATQTDKDEVKVMKLVGAPNMLIVGPTTVMGVLAGILGAVLALIILYFIGREIAPYTDAFANFNVLQWYVKNIQYFIIFTLSFGIAIGFLGSLLAIRRHL